MAYLGGDHVVQLRPLLRRSLAAIALPALAIQASIAVLATLPHATVPDNLNRRVVGKSTRQQLEGREVPSTDDNDVRSSHMRSDQLIFSPQTAFARDQLRDLAPRRNNFLKMFSSTRSTANVASMPKP